MGDIIDDAQESIEFTEKLEIDAIRDQLHMPGQERCEDCGEVIPQERRKLIPSAVTCFNCQYIRELKIRCSPQ